MPFLRPGEGYGPPGTRDEASILYGDWSYIGVISAGTEYEIGNAPEAVATMTREDVEHVSTAFPRMVDIVATLRVGMMFEGKMEEIHHQNMHLLVGDVVGNSALYIYVGDRKDCTFFTFSAKRERICDGRTLEFYMWKCLSRGLVQIGGGDNATSTPFQFTALSDIAGDYGGSTSAPLGYLYVPAINT